MTGIVIDGEEVITDKEWETLVRVEELKQQAEWERYVREHPAFAARLQRELNKIPAMVEEMEAGR